MEFKKLVDQPFGRTTVRVTEEEKYWQKFKSTPVNVGLTSGVTNVAFNPTNSDFALTSGTKVNLYDGKTGKLRKMLSRFKNIAHGGDFRYDGKLFAAGCETGDIYVFEILKGELLRMFKGHKNAVHVTKFAPSQSFVMSGSDDKTVRYWDVSTEAELCVFRGHTDHVRSCTHVKQSIWATGSYDHTVRLWDVRDQKMECKLQLDHPHGPLEDILAFEDGNLIAGAAGSHIAVWDLRKSTEPVAMLNDHQKTITTLFLDGTKSRLMSGSLDGIIKVVDFQTFECTSSIVIGSGKGILSAGMSKDNSILIAGCVSGDAIIRRRVTKASDEDGGAMMMDRTQNELPPLVGTKRYFMRGGNVGPSVGDFKVPSNKRKKQNGIDFHLRKFNYKQSLEEALNTKQVSLVMSTLSELIQRDGLEAALSGRDDTSLEPIVSFVVKYITNARFSEVLIEVCETILKLYAGDIGQSTLIDELFVKLQRQLKKELKVQADLFKLRGSVELILNNSK